MSRLVSEDTNQFWHRHIYARALYALQSTHSAKVLQRLPTPISQHPLAAFATRHFRCGPAVDTGKHDRQRALDASALTTFLNEQRWLPGDRVQSPPPTPISILTSTYTTPHLKSKINVEQQIKASNPLQLSP